MVLDSLADLSSSSVVGEVNSKGFAMNHIFNLLQTFTSIAIGNRRSAAILLIFLTFSTLHRDVDALTRIDKASSSNVQRILPNKKQPPTTETSTAEATTENLSVTPPITIEPIEEIPTIEIRVKKDGNCPSLEVDIDDCTNDELTTKLTHACRYDRLNRPETKGPLNVTIQMDIKHIEAIDQLKFMMQLLIQFKYTDYRLKYNHISPRRGTILGENLLREKIWVPHIVFTNEKKSSLMGLEKNDLFVSISPDGEVIYSYRLTTSIYCWMDLKKFPFDVQTCDLTMRSWTYNVSNLLLSWDDVAPVQIASPLHLTEYSLTGWNTYGREEAAPLSKGAFVGNFSMLVFEFKLSREIGFYVLDYFIPSILLVSLSWVTFWIQADMSAPRVTLGTSTMLAFITLASGQSKQLPKVSYIKASEIWFLGCTVFIFASMVEFAFVNIIWRRRKKVELKKVNSKYILKSTLTPRLARKELLRTHSMSSLPKSRSCSSLINVEGTPKQNPATYNNYLTVHSFPSNLPKVTTDPGDDMAMHDSQETISLSVPARNNANEKDASTEDAFQKWTSMTPQEVAIWIDKRSRLAFPVAFLVFNVIYWAYVYL